MEKRSVYIETTIPSLVTARPPKNTADVFRQHITQEFWEYEKHKYDLYISQYVITECKKGDAYAAKKRLDLIENIRLLPITSETEKLAEEYFKFLKIPQKAKTDCFHLAICVINEIDFLISWNMTHLGSPTYSKIVLFNGSRDLWLPELLTPDMLMDIKREEEQNGSI